MFLTYDLLLIINQRMLITLSKILERKLGISELIVE